MEKPLRILIVVDLPWDARLGASRIFIELAEAWRKAGHVVSKFCMTDAYSTPARSRVLSALRQLLFPGKAAAFVRKNRDQFDIIDALMGTMPFPKKRLRFPGLVVARSVGFYRLYQKFETFASQRWADQPRGKLVGRIFYRFFLKRAIRASDRSLENCDLVNFPNEGELDFFRHEPESDKPAIVQPYGLTTPCHAALRDTAAEPAQRLAAKKVCFIGMWSVRKGARDWGEIIRRVRAAIPEARFLFLGTLTDSQTVLRDLGLRACDYLEMVREYSPDELPKLLADSTAGALPTYAEGFGLALLELLAAGIPSAAYDAPGPKSILRDELSKFLIPAGDTGSFAACLIRILNSEQDTYESFCRQSIEMASHFTWAPIAEATAQSYRANLSQIAMRRDQ